MDNDMAAVFGVVGVTTIFAFLIGFTTFVVAARSRERSRAQFDLQRRMLERFGSGAEFGAFLVYAATIGILLWRPQGLFGVRT